MTLGIYGSGGLGRAVSDLSLQINKTLKKWEKIVFINDFKHEPFVNGTEVFTFDEHKVSFPADQAKIVIAVGEPKIRKILREKVAACEYRLQSLVHPAAFIGSRTQIGDGTIVQFGSFVECDVSVGSNVLILQNSSVGHDSVIGNDAVISPCAFVAGACTIGERAYIAACVPVKENISIGADSIIGMGSAVLRDIPEGVIALGNPARVMKNNESGQVFK